MNFCSDCKWAKFVEEADKMVIYCTKPAPENKDAHPNRWVRKINIRKRLTATACGNFECESDDKTNR